MGGRARNNGLRGAMLDLSRALLGLLLALDAAALKAAVPLERDFTIRAWRREQGLPDSRVLSVLCSRQGPVWVGTRKGVSRFDGARFVTWGRSTDTAFASETCIALAEDGEGVVWIGTPDNLLSLGQRVTRIDPLAIGLGSLFPEGQIPSSSLVVTRDGELLVGTGRGMIRRTRTGVWNAPSLAPVGHRREAATAFHENPVTGCLWLSLDWRLLELTPLEFAWSCRFDNNLVRDGRHVVALTSLPNGECVAIRELWPELSGRLESLRDGRWFPVVDRDLTNGGNTPYLLVDAQGRLWFALNAATMGCWRDGALTEYALPAFLAGDRLNCLAQDREGNFWAGTARNGLLCFQPRRVLTLDPSAGSGDPKTYALIESSRGQLWAAIGSGLALLNADNGPLFARAEALTSDSVRALAEDHQGRLWIGTRSGLQRWNGHQLEPVDYPGPTFRTKIRTLCPARDGSIWVGTAQGLFHIASQTTNVWGVAEGLPHENVCALLEDRQGAIWIGTGGGGLARWDGRRFEPFTPAQGLSSGLITCLLEDAEGLIWAGTDRGLNVLRQGRFRSITTDHKLPENLVNALVEDNHGWLWVGHDRGVYRAPRQELLAVAEGRARITRCIEYAEADGLINPECSGQTSAPTARRLRDGRIAFATMGGVAVFDPASLPDSTNGPPVLIDAFRAGNVEPGGAIVRLLQGQHPNHEPVLHLPALGRALLAIHYTAVDFHAPERLSFRYRLLGLSERWLDAGAVRQATFANLPPGQYTFQVQAVNHQGYASRVPASLAFVAAPRWHERPGVRLAGIVILLAVGYAGLRWRLAELRRYHQLEHQAALAEERSRLAKDLHDGLGANLTEITLLSHFDPGQNAGPVQSNRLHQLARSAQDAMLALRELIWVTTPEADDLAELVSRIHATAERVLEAAGVRCIVEIPPDLPTVTVMPTLRRDLLFGVNEALNNVIRHAQASEVRLSVAFPDGHLLLSIVDNGRGLPAVDSAHAVPTGDHGLGLASLRQRLGPHGGDCRIEGASGRGTRVTFRVPLPRPHPD